MVSLPPVVFDVVLRGPQNWRVCVDGLDEHVPFADREICIAAAMSRARLRHLETGCATEVWAPRFIGSGERVCLIRYMTPSDLDGLLRFNSTASSIFGASFAYPASFPGSGR